MSTATAELVNELDKTLAAAAELDAKRKSDALAEYQTVVKGAKKITPAELLKLLDRCGLTPDDFKADAAAWQTYNATLATMPSPDAIAKAHKKHTESVDAYDTWQRKTRIEEQERLLAAMNDASMEASAIKAQKEQADKQLHELRTNHRRVFAS